MIEEIIRTPIHLRPFIGSFGDMNTGISHELVSDILVPSLYNGRRKQVLDYRTAWTFASKAKTTIDQLNFPQFHIFLFLSYSLFLSLSL